MGVKGAAIGAGLGFLLGHSWLGALFGAWMGHGFEERKKFAGGRRTAEGRAFSSMPDRKRAAIFCASAAAMLAKMAKADGHVSSAEISGVERAFARLGFSPAAREYAVKVFRKAKDDTHTIYEYAADFLAVVPSIAIRELLYEILWDIACADGVISPAELDLLRNLPRALGIRSEWFDYFSSTRICGGAGARGATGPSRDPVADAYAVLGASASESDEALKRKYRDLAKKNHPDALRAQGLPEAMIGKATERMSRINDAWTVIRKERGI